jgi:hypothetical protein
MASELLHKVRRHKDNRRAGKPRLNLEALETRQLPTAFTPGNLIVLRSGDGTPYDGTAPLFLDEYNIPNRNIVQTAAIPNDQMVGGPGNQPITIDLSAAAGNGQLNRSYDGSVLTFGGVDSGINSTTATGSADRVIAITGNDPAANNFLDTTTHGQFYVGDDNRGAVAESANGPRWSAGHPNQAGGAVSQGVHYFPMPGPSIGTQVSAGANIRGVTIGFDNRLYFSTAGSAQTGLAGIYTEPQALPTNPTPARDIPITSALFTASKLGGIYLADVNGTGVISDGDRLYFLDDGTVGGAGTGGLYVSTYNSSFPGNHWSTAVRLGEGIIDGQPHPQPTAQLRGLAGTVINGTETDLYVTEFDNVANNNSYILKFADSGSGVTIATASEVGNLVTITTSLPNNFTTGQTVVVDGIDPGHGGSLVSDGYNGSWQINVLDSTHFTYTDTNPSGSGLGTVTNQGAADVAVSPTIVATLADGSTMIGVDSFAAQGIRGVAFAPAAPTAIGLTVDGGSSTTVPPGTAVTFVATLDNPQVTPAGLVTFIDQNTNTVLGQAPIVTMNGVTSATFVDTLVGNHFVTAYFAGGGAAALASATSNPVTVIEAGDTPSATMLTPSLLAAAVGLPVQLTANVSGGNTVPTGTVSFYNGGTNFGSLIGTATLDANGVASLPPTSFTTVGDQFITAIYNGDDTYASSQDMMDVTTAPNALATITSSANYVPPGSTPTYTVTLNGNDTLGTPSGTVQFFLDGVALGGVQTLVPGTNNTATASIDSTGIAPLTAGSHFVTVSWTADNPYASYALNTTTATNGVAFIETAQQAFAPGDLIAVQRGDGSVNLGSSGYLVFIDEYTTGGHLVQQIALPNIDTDTGHALLLSGQNGAEGLINRSADGYYLTIAGYDVAVGQQFVTSTFPFQYPRTIARIDGAANVDTTTAITTRNAHKVVPYNPLDVVSYDGNEFWLVSNLATGDTRDSGIEYVHRLGATRATQIGPVGTSGDSLVIANGQLYAASTNRTSGTPVGVWQIGNGLPTSRGTPLMTLSGLTGAYQAAFPNTQNAKQLLFFNHNDGTSNNPDTLFIADQSHGLLKFWFDGTIWHFGGQKLVFAGGVTGVVGSVVNPGPNAQFQLYVTGTNFQGNNPNQIADFLDTNPFNSGFAPGNFNTLVFVGQMNGSPNGNENFAGLAFAPGLQTTTHLTWSSDAGTAGASTTLTATVRAPSGTPTGSVTFYDGDSVIGTTNLDSDGVATLTTSVLTGGNHVIQAIYNGDVKDGTSGSVQTIAVALPPSLESRSTASTTATDSVGAVTVNTSIAYTFAGNMSDNSGRNLSFGPSATTTLWTVGNSPSDNGQNLASTSAVNPADAGVFVDAFWQRFGVNAGGTLSPWVSDFDVADIVASLN